MEILKYPNFKIGKEFNYLSDVIDELPHNCIYTKNVTGAGGTTVALKSNQHYVVCVPFTELIRNKMKSNKNLLGVYKGISIKQIKDYLNDYRIPIKKIMVTYDSLPKILKYIKPNDYKILIDEYQELFKSVVFRCKAVRGVLDNFDKFKSYCFMTATMMDDDFIIKELKHLPVYETEWENIKEVTIDSCKCETNVIHTVSYLVDNYKKNVYSGNAHIFVNSVEFIKQIVKNCELNDENARAIWSQHNESLTGLVKSNTTDDVKKINLYTSTCYCGSDLFDEEAHIYIVSDDSKPHTLVDVYSDISQINGRIRNTRFWNKITHIYTNTRHNTSLSYEEYKDYVQKEIIRAEQDSKEYDTFSDSMKRRLQTTAKKNQIKQFGEYMILDNDKLVYDENLMCYDMYYFKLTKCTYKVRVNLTQQYEDKGFKVTFLDLADEVKHITGEEQKIEKVTAINRKVNLKENIEEYMKGDVNFAAWMFNQYKWFKEAVELLGVPKIIDLKYNIGNIQRHINNKKYFRENDIIAAELRLHYKITEGVFVPLSDIKEIFRTVYKNLGIKKTPKASDIEKYWSCKNTVRKLNTSSVRGYDLITELK